MQDVNFHGSPVKMPVSGLSDASDMRKIQPLSFTCSTYEIIFLAPLIY